MPDHFNSLSNYPQSDFIDFEQNIISPVQIYADSITRKYGIKLSVKREDLNHQEVSGNKFRKLKYNIKAAEQLHSSALLSFGGAYSNHILALSAVGRILHWPTVGIIRGDELATISLNPVLKQASANGMILHFISREEYRHKNDPIYLKTLKTQFGDVFVIPEGGSNHLGIHGASEIINSLDRNHNYVICACGTGGTLAGIVNGLASNKMHSTIAIGIAVLKAPVEKYQADIRQFLANFPEKPVNLRIINDYHMGGYAKSTDELNQFIRWYENLHGLQLEPVYTGKLFYAVYSLIEAGYFAKGSSILLIHTGGLQTKQLCSQGKS